MIVRRDIHDILESSDSLPGFLHGEEKSNGEYSFMWKGVTIK